MAGFDLTPYLTPAMLMSSNFGISWKTFPIPNAAEPEQINALMDICWTVTSTMDTLANQALRATIDIENEFGPDYTITVQQNGWVRFRLSHWPILQLVAAQYSPASSSPPTYSPIPASALVTEHSALPLPGTIVPDGAGPGPTAALIAPGYVNWSLGRKGYYVQVTAVNGFPTTGIDQAATAGATSIHVDDITGWWNGTAGARGTIYDPPFREFVVVQNAVPDTVGAISGPGQLTLGQGLQFSHTPKIGSAQVTNQKILMSAMPQALLQAGYYLATHYGLIRGSTAATIMTAQGGYAPSGIAAAQDWFTQAEHIIDRYGRVF